MYLANWYGVLIFDLIVGIFIGLIVGAFSVLMSRDDAKLLKSIFVTDFVWLIFCFWWYFNNRGAINTEAFGHLISPVIVGAAGFALAVINLAYVLLANKKSRTFPIK